MPRVEYSLVAESDLFQIGQYIARQDLAAACRLYDEIERKAELYAGKPQLGELWSEFGRNVRAFRVGRYLVLYRPTKSGIEMIRVLHTARDLPQAFSGDI